MLIRNNLSEYRPNSSEFSLKKMNSNPLIWFHLYDNETGLPYKGTSSDAVSLPSPSAISQFRKAVKTEYFDSHLKGIAASDLKVFKNKYSFNRRHADVRKEEPLKSSRQLDGLGETEEDALIVAVGSTDTNNFKGSSLQTDDSIQSSALRETLKRALEVTGIYDERKKLNTGIAQKLVSSVGADFSFLDREYSFEILASSLEQRFYCRKVGLGDKQPHKLPFLANGPGSGKSRFLQELPNSFVSYVKNLSQSVYEKPNCGEAPEAVVSYLKNSPKALSDFKNALSSALFINVSFSDYNAKELVQEIEVSLCLRIVYPFFDSQCFNFLSFYDRYVNNAISLPNLTLANTLKSVNKENQCIVLGIDDLNILHSESQENVGKLFAFLASFSCAYSPFFVPVLAGTVMCPMEDVVSNYMHPSLHIPLPLISFDSCLKILSAKDYKFANQVQTDQSLRNAVSNLGGHCRALELFYEQLSKFPSGSPNCWNFLMDHVCFLLSELYPMSKLPEIRNVIAFYFLSMCVKKEQKLSEFEYSLTFQNLEDYGILKLERQSDNSIRVKLPYIFVICYFKSARRDEYSKFWSQSFLSRMCWESWQEFNNSYIAFRLSLFASLGITRMLLSTFLSGAKMNIPPNIILKIPSIKDMNTTITYDSFPLTIQTDSKIGTCVQNAPVSAFDGFVYLETTAGKLLLGHQNLFSRTDPIVAKKITDIKLALEHQKINDSIARYIPETDCIILFLGRCEGVYDAEKLPSNCAVVSLNECEEFYGELYNWYLIK